MLSDGGGEGRLEKNTLQHAVVCRCSVPLKCSSGQGKKVSAMCNEPKCSLHQVIKHM